MSMCIIHFYLNLFTCMNYWYKTEKKFLFILGTAFILLQSPSFLFAQSDSTAQKTGVIVSESATLTNAGLQDVIQYAIKNQPSIQQSVVDERITEDQIRTRLADWYP